MPICHDIRCRERQAGSGLFGAERCQFPERLRRGEFGADRLALLCQNLNRHEAGAFLEQESLRRFCSLRRQHKGGPDIGMARERDFGANRENANLRIMRGIARRQHERRLRIIELGRNRLHLRGRQPAGIQHYRKRIAAEGAVGENVHGDITPLHFVSPYPNCHTVIGWS